MVSRGSVRTAARRRMGSEREVVDLASVDMDLQNWTAGIHNEVPMDILARWLQTGFRRDGGIGAGG
jgi:hypothetical protein